MCAFMPVGHTWKCSHLRRIPQTVLPTYHHECPGHRDLYEGVAPVRIYTKLSHAASICLDEPVYLVCALLQCRSFDCMRGVILCDRRQSTHRLNTLLPVVVACCESRSQAKGGVRMLHVQEAGQQDRQGFLARATVQLLCRHSYLKQDTDEVTPFVV